MQMFQRFGLHVNYHEMDILTSYTTSFTSKQITKKICIHIQKTESIKSRKIDFKQVYNLDLTKCINDLVSNSSQNFLGKNGRSPIRGSLYK